MKTEKEIENIFSSNGIGIILTRDKLRLFELETKKIQFLKKEDATWRLKSRALWLEKGDYNMKYFHRFANHRHTVNSIWELDDLVGNVISGQEALKKANVDHF